MQLKRKMLAHSSFEIDEIKHFKKQKEKKEKKKKLDLKEKLLIFNDHRMD